MVTMENGILMVDGKHFIPVGFFSDQQTKWLADMRELGCNCVVPNGFAKQPDWLLVNYLNVSHTQGLRVILNLADFPIGNERLLPLLGKVKDHPALLALMLRDEPECRNEDAEAVGAWTAKVREVVKLPVYMTFYKAIGAQTYAGSYDILGTTVYPVPQDPLTAVWGRMDSVGLHTAVPQWTCIQACAYPGRVGGRVPTPFEIERMTGLAVDAGAKGILWWCRYRITDAEWTRLRPTFAELAGKIKV